MKKVVLDFGGLGSEREVHQYLQEQFGFPEYYGKNLDALYDCMTELAGDTRILFAGTQPQECGQEACEAGEAAADEGMRRFLKNVRRVIEDAAEENSHLFL